MPVPRFAQFIPRATPTPQLDVGQIVQRMQQSQESELRQQQLRAQIAKALRPPEYKPQTAYFKSVRDFLDLAHRIPNPTERAKFLHNFDIFYGKKIAREHQGEYTKKLLQEKGKAHAALLSDITKHGEAQRAMLPSIRAFIGAAEPLPEEIFRSVSSGIVASLPTEIFTGFKNGFINITHIDRFLSQQKKDQTRQDEQLKKKIGLTAFEKNRSLINQARAAQTKLLADFLKTINTGSLSEGERIAFARGIPDIAQGKDAALKIARQMESVAEKGKARQEFYRMLQEKEIPVDRINSLWDMYSESYPLITHDGKFMPENIDKWVEFTNPNNIGKTGLSLDQIYERSERQQIPSTKIVESVIRRQEAETKGIGEERPIRPVKAFDRVPEETREFVSSEYKRGILIGNRRLSKEDFERKARHLEMEPSEVKEWFTREGIYWRDL